jgi:hypothetical protein
MGCNCGKKKQVINNLNIPSYVQMAKDFMTSIGNTSVEQLEEHQWAEAYHIYNSIFPNSKGQPERSELLTIINNAANYKNKR